MLFLLTVMPASVERSFGVLAGDVLGRQVDQHQVVIGAARHDPEAVLGQALGKRLGVLLDLALVLLESRLQRLLEGNGFAAITCTRGPPWMPGKITLSTALPNFSLHMIMPPRGPRSVL